MKKLMIFDFNHLLYKGIHTNLTYEGKFTGGLYAFINQFCKQVNDYKPEEIIFCGDCPPYFRKDILKTYKASRKKKREPMRVERYKQSLQVCNEFLNMINVPYWTVPGMEADDLIANLTADIIDRKIYIISNDSDLFQLLGTNVTLIRNNKKYELKDFYQEFGEDISPFNMPLIMSMVGTHNEIKGLEGIGIKKAMKIFRDKDLYTKTWNENEELLYRNLKLIFLPFQEVKPIEINRPNFRMRDINVWLAQSGIVLNHFMREAFNTAKRLD